MSATVIAAIAAIAGAASGTTNYIYSNKESRRDYQAAKEKLQRQKAEALALMDAQFASEQKTAFKNADRSDARSTLDEGLTSLNFNNQLDLLGLSEEAETWAWNREAESISANLGDELSVMAASGTRGSSLSDAIDMEAAQNIKLLQLEQDTQRAQDTYSLNQLINSLQNNLFDLQANRTDAFDLRTTYSEGGDQFNLFRMQRAQTENAYNDAISELDDAISKTIFSWKNTFRHFNGITTALFRGASQGLDVYGKVSSYLSKSGSYTGGDTNTHTKQLNYSWNNNLSQSVTSLT